MKPKNLIFDVGDVLLDYRWKQMLMDYGLSDSEAERVGREMFDDPEHLWSIFDLGTFSQEEIIEQYCEKYPKDAEAIRYFISHGEYMSVPRPSIWKRLSELKEKGYRLYILSNYPEELFRKHTQYADFMQEGFMDGVLVSYMVQLAKPNAKIYEELCRRFNLLPEECLFYDDRRENVEGAIAFGMQSKQVLSKEWLEEELEKL